MLTRLAFAALICLGLAACGDPLDRVGRLSEVDIPADAPRVGVHGEADRPGILTEARASAAAGEPAPIRTASAGPRGGFLGLFRGGASSSGSGEAVDVEPGQVLPFGRAGRVCNLPRSQLGTEVARYPERGGKYRLHDTAPGTVGPHTFYITGFKDDCPRQVTAALGLFGDVGMHESLRYGAAESALPWSDTDNAYDKVKMQVCGTGRRKPCGGRIGRMEKSTVFLTLYERFGDNSRWSNLLIHDGEIVAQDIESN